MAVSYLTKTELGEFFHSNGNIEAGVRSALIDSLEQSGVFNEDDNSARGWVQSGPFPGGEVPPVVQILGVSNSTNVETNPNLKAIVLDDDGARLDVTGGDNDVFVGAGRGDDTINLNDSGNDTVYGGSGNDVIRASEGDNMLFGGAGNDSLYGGTGNDTLDGGAGNDLLVSGGARAAGGSGDARIASADDSAFGVAGREHGHGGGGGEIVGHSTLIGGAGNDTLVGVQGDVLQGGRGDDHFTLLSGDENANSTLYGGGGDDSFRIEARSGSDTIFGGNGNDTAEFAGRSFFDVARVDVDESTSTYTLHFSDEQTVAVNGVEELHFSDQIVTLPKLS